MFNGFDVTYVAMSFSQPFTVAGDIAKEDDTKRIMESTIKEFGQLNILVN